MPRLRVYRSNHLEALLEVLLGLLERPDQRPIDPFAAVRVGAGSRGMERWLRHRIAERLGICAGFDFPFPAAVVEDVLARVGVSPSQGWRPDTLVWAVLDALPEHRDGPLGAWAGTSEGPASLARGGLCPPSPSPPASEREWAVARAIASAFDRIALLRPEVALAWTAGQPGPDVPADLSWQADVWRSVRTRLGPCIAERVDEARRRIRSGEVATSAFDQPVRMFGVASPPPIHLHLLSDLARIVDVDVFAPSPAGGWLGSDGTGGHPLVRALGRQARDFLEVLESLPEGVAERVDLFVDRAAAASAVRPPTALETLQADIVSQRSPAESSPDSWAGRAIQPSDDSIRLHACPGPSRQVEVLRDALLGLFDDHPDLNPRDVVVLVPDLERYAALVEAAFASGRAAADGNGPPPIPFSIAGHSSRNHAEAGQLVLRLLELGSGRSTANEVVDALESPPVAAGFGFGTAELRRARDLIRSAGARWGIDEGDVERNGVPPDRLHTWRFAFERLLVGVAFGEATGRLGADGLWEGVAPLDAGEGRHADVVLRLSDACHLLFGEAAALREPRTCEAWASQAVGALDRLAGGLDEDVCGVGRTRKVLTDLAQAAGDARCGRALDAEAFGAALSDVLSVAPGGPGEQGGSVSVCALAPMRSVPYRVVCLLGMDDGAFPRDPSRPSYDLVSRRRRAGDRDAREEDLGLFLEAILAARDHLLVCWTGRDPCSGERREPSVPVAELREALDASFPQPGGRRPSEGMTVNHPLQAFAPRAFAPDGLGAACQGRPWSFDRRLLAAAEAARNGPRRVPPFFAREGSPVAAECPESGPPELDIEALARFLGNPARDLLRSMRIRLDEGEEPLEDRGPVEIAGWHADRLARDLLVARLGGRSREEAVARMRAEGRLPPGSAGRRAVAEPSAVADAFANAAAPWMGGTRESVDLRVELSDMALTGRIDEAWSGRIVVVEPASGLDGEGRPWWLLGPWLRMLAWRAMRPGRTARPAGGEREGGRSPPLAQVAVIHPEGRDPVPTATLLDPGGATEAERAERARGFLEAVVALWRQGRDRPLQLFPRASWAYVHGDRTLFAAVAAWHGAHTRGDRHDPYIARVWPGSEPPFVVCGQHGRSADPEFASAANVLWGPIRASMRPAGDPEACR